MRDEIVGVKRVADGVCHVLLGPVLLGALHERSRIVVPIDADDAGVTHVPGQKCHLCARLHRGDARTCADWGWLIVRLLAWSGY